jgi:hypothetical protein
LSVTFTHGSASTKVQFPPWQPTCSCAPHRRHTRGPVNNPTHSTGVFIDLARGCAKVSRAFELTSRSHSTANRPPPQSKVHLTSPIRRGDRRFSTARRSGKVEISATGCLKGNLDWPESGRGLRTPPLARVRACCGHRI